MSEDHFLRICLSADQILQCFYPALNHYSNGKNILVFEYFAVTTAESCYISSFVGQPSYESCGSSFFVANVLFSRTPCLNSS